MVICFAVFFTFWYVLELVFPLRLLYRCMQNVVLGTEGDLNPRLLKMMQSVWQCHTLTSNFRKAAQLIKRPVFPSPGTDLKPTEILVKNSYVGINASDINWTAGRYDPNAKPPFDLGFEGLGEIVGRGKGVASTIKDGQFVAYMKYGAFADYITLDSRHVFPVPSADPGFLPLLVSGMTASIGLEEVGRIRPDKNPAETILVTAAAGGTGQFAVQWAKLHGCHVIGTTSSDSKGKFLSDIGCDRVINYKTEDFSQVLRTEYPKGVDCVYESVGGGMFDVCLNNLAQKGRLVVIGFITDYQDEKTGFKPNKSLSLLPAKLLRKSASVGGFFLFHYADQFPVHFLRLARLYAEGKLTSKVDLSYRGLESIPDAVEYLHSGKSLGKVVVDLTA